MRADRVVEGVDVEAGGWRLAAQLRRVLDEIPQLGGSVCAAWEAACRGDDGNRLRHGCYLVTMLQEVTWDTGVVMTIAKRTTLIDERYVPTKAPGVFLRQRGGRFIDCPSYTSATSYPRAGDFQNSESCMDIWESLIDLATDIPASSILLFSETIQSVNMC